MPRTMNDVRFDFARCRVLRHSWETTGETEGGGSKLIVQRCTSCGTIRYDRWNTRTGDRWGKPNYIYPIGYQDRIEGRDADWWRVTYAEFLFKAGILGKAPASDTRPNARKRA